MFGIREKTRYCAGKADGTRGFEPASARSLEPPRQPGRRAPASSVAPICQIWVFPASLDRIHPGRLGDEASCRSGLCRRAPAYPVSGVSGPDPIGAAGISRPRRRSSASRPASPARSASSARSSPGDYFGVQGEINAFTVAFQVPNLVRALVADAALSAAFVPVFSELLEKGEKARAWRVASTRLLAAAARPLRHHRALHAARAAHHGALRHAAVAYDDLAVTLSRILFPIVDPARRLGRDRRRSSTATSSSRSPR